MREFFRQLAKHAARAMGSPFAFAIALLIILVWALLGPVFGFSNTWQLVINSTTTVITFLVVFMIQNTQNRDSKALHLKLDELIRSIRGARNGLIDSEDLPDVEIDRLEHEFARLREQAPSLKAATPKVSKSAPIPDHE